MAGGLMTYYTFINTPAGEVLLVGSGSALRGLYWKVFKRMPKVQPDWIEDNMVFTQIIQQLDEYFAGKRQVFDFEFELQGTEFQKEVWNELLKIPFGSKLSYQAVADAIGRPKAVRAVGTAIGSNPICIVVPCHRVLTSTQQLGGYAGGLDGKEVLLKNEGIHWKTAK
jgi:methylated-DNA-[protein]-cysteine S-methyltransferase